MGNAVGSSSSSDEESAEHSEKSESESDSSAEDKGNEEGEEEGDGKGEGDAPLSLFSDSESEKNATPSKFSFFISSIQISFDFYFQPRRRKEQGSLTVRLKLPSPKRALPSPQKALPNLKRLPPPRGSNLKMMPQRNCLLFIPKLQGKGTKGARKSGDSLPPSVC